MLYDLSNGFDKNRFQTRTAALINRAAVVELTERRQRTSGQNKYLHTILSALAVELGETVDYVKEFYYKRLVNPTLFIRNREDRYLGRLEFLRSTSDLSKDEMSISIDRFRSWAAAQGFYLPSADEHLALLSIEREAGRNGEFL